MCRIEPVGQTPYRVTDSDRGRCPFESDCPAHRGGLAFTGTDA